MWRRSGVLGQVPVQDWEGGAQQDTGSSLVSTASNDFRGRAMEKFNYFRGRAMEKFVAEGNVPRWNLHSVDSVLLYLSTTKPQNPIQCFLDCLNRNVQIVESDGKALER